ncbi:MAG: DUF4372 domain-containing protein [Paludibacter sp.]|nr:DUF4372 domain-containing protein [Paludibacter sp.]
MIFGQLTDRNSLRDLMLSLIAHQAKYYHQGFVTAFTYQT